MKKQYKFKAWNGEELSEPCNIFSDNAFIFKNSENIFVNDTEISNLKLMEFINDVDKNGEELYEGYIVKDANGYTEVITWSNDCYSRKYGWESLSLNGENDNYYYGGFNSSNREIIGNIYENPELLK